MRRREGVEYMKTGGNVCRDSLVTHYLLWCPAVVHLLLRRGTLVIWCWEEGFLLWEWKVKGVFPSFPCFSWKEQVLPPVQGDTLPQIHTGKTRTQTHRKLLRRRLFWRENPFLQPFNPTSCLLLSPLTLRWMFLERRTTVSISHFIHPRQGESKGDLKKAPTWRRWV